MTNYPTLDEFLLENLQEDPEFYEAYLEVSLEEFQEDNDTQALLKSLRRLAEAKGGIPRLAKQIGLSKQGLYKALSSDGSPKLSTVTKILQGLGYRLTIEPLLEPKPFP